MTAAPKPQLKYLKVTAIQENPGINPNAMDPSEFEMLTNAIAKLGFIQPVTVRTGNDGFVLVDGHHRFRAAQAAGLKEIPVLIADHLEDPQAAAAMLSLNRLRGTTDLAKAALVLKDLSDLKFPDLTLTGFSGGDIELMLKDLAQTNTFDDLGPGAYGEGGGLQTEEASMTNQKRYALRLVLDAAEDRDEIKATALRYGTTLESGLLELCRRFPQPQES
jgi:hypothetical protein